MAKSTALQKIVKEAKALRKRNPNKFNHLKKSERWSKGYIKAASASYTSSSAPARKPKRKKVTGTKRKPAKKRRSGRKVVKQVERRSVERVLAGRKPARRRKRRVVMAGKSRRRSVGKSGGSKGLLIGLGLGALALFLLSKKSTPTYSTTNLPPISQTQNYTRNTQANDLVQYAMAAGLAFDAIYKLIDRLNSSGDQEVQNIYDHVNTTGDFTVYV